MRRGLMNCENRALRLLRKNGLMLRGIEGTVRSTSPTSPELPPDAFKNAVRGRFYRPVKQAVSLRLDADVIAWLKKDGDGYQTRVNQMLRERMLAELNKAG